MARQTRYWIVLATVGLWIAAGFALRLCGWPNFYGLPRHVGLRIAYQLLGIPLLIGFQCVVARRPLSEVWFRPTRWDRLAWWGYCALGLLLGARYLEFRQHGSWAVRFYLLCTAGGAIPVVYSLKHWKWAALRPSRRAAFCFGLFGILAVCAGFAAYRLGLTRQIPQVPSHPFRSLLAHPGEQMISWAISFLGALSGWFVVEEVFFRGCMDSFLHRPGDPHPHRSAAFVSFLWGLWHIPFYSILWAQWGNRNFMLILILGPLATAIGGIPLSILWRRTGLLLVPAALHAFFDATAYLFHP